MSLSLRLASKLRIVNAKEEIEILYDWYENKGNDQDDGCEPKCNEQSATNDDYDESEKWTLSQNDDNGDHEEDKSYDEDCPLIDKVESLQHEISK